MATLALIQLDPVAAEPTTIPDPDRPHPAGLTWLAPLESRPIVLGPSANHPVLVPALAIGADRFWSHVKHGLAVGYARREMDTAAVRYALSPDMSRSGHLAIAMVEAAEDWDRATTNYAKEYAL